MADDEDRIREEAHKIWLAEGRPEGRAERHWTEAKEIIALKDSFETTLLPLEKTISEPVEPALAFENQADVPGLTDNGDDRPGPSWDAVREMADVAPLSPENSAAEKKSAPSASRSGRT